MKDINSINKFFLKPPNRRKLFLWRICAKRKINAVNGLLKKGMASNASIELVAKWNL
jgi:hypothetical protein